MQFGKFHAWAFIALGLLLVVVQAVLFFAPDRDVRSPGEVSAVTHRTTTMPGIVGCVALVVGIGLYMANRNKPQE